MLSEGYIKRRLRTLCHRRSQPTTARYTLPRRRHKIWFAAWMTSAPGLLGLLQCRPMYAASFLNSLSTLHVRALGNVLLWPSQ